MASPFVSSLRASLGVPDSNAPVSTCPIKSTDKSAMVSMFSGLDLALDASGSVVSGKSAAKDLLASKRTEKEAEAQFEASQALKKQQKQQQQPQKEEPVTALSQALSFFDKEMNDRDSFLSKRRRTSGKKPRRGATGCSRGRVQRHNRYKRV